MKYYFKVWKDYTNYVPVDETEFEKAMYAFEKGGGAMFDLGAIGTIKDITPDFNKDLGWYSDYKPTPDDNADIDALRPKYQKYIHAIKEKIQYLKSTNQTDLIGKNVDIPELDKPKDDPLSGEIKSLSDKFKV